MKPSTTSIVEMTFPHIFVDRKAAAANSLKVT